MCSMSFLDIVWVIIEIPRNSATDFHELLYAYDDIIISTGHAQRDDDREAMTQCHNCFDNNVLLS